MMIKLNNLSAKGINRKMNRELGLDLIRLKRANVLYSCPYSNLRVPLQEELDEMIELAQVNIASIMGVSKDMIPDYAYYDE